MGRRLWEADCEFREFLERIVGADEEFWAAIPRSGVGGSSTAGVVVTDRRVVLVDYEFEQLGWGRKQGHPVLRSEHDPERVRVIQYRRTYGYNTGSVSTLELLIDADHWFFYSDGGWMPSGPKDFDRVVAALGGNQAAGRDRWWRGHRRVEPRQPRAHHSAVA